MAMARNLTHQETEKSLQPCIPRDSSRRVPQIRWHPPLHARERVIKQWRLNCHWHWQWVSNHWVGAWDGKSGMTSSSSSGGRGGGSVCRTMKVSDDCGRNEKKHQSPDIVGPRAKNNGKCKAVLICGGKVGGVRDAIG